MLIKDVLPEELYDLLINGVDPDESPAILIESVQYTGADIRVVFSVRFESYMDTPPQFWELVAEGVEEEKICREWSHEMEYYEDHVLLLEYNDIQTELYFTGKAADTDILFLDIYRSLIQLSHSLADVSKYILNVDNTTIDGYGLFARGPKTILALYAECLIKHGIKPKFIGEYTPGKRLKLLKLGSSYFIGDGFSFSRLS